MASGIDPAPSITPCTVFEAGVELYSGANYATEGTGAGKKMAESIGVPGYYPSTHQFAGT